MYVEMIISSFFKEKGDNNFLVGNFLSFFYLKSLLVWMSVAINNMQRCVSLLAENDFSIS